MDVHFAVSCQNVTPPPREYAQNGPIGLAMAEGGRRRTYLTSSSDDRNTQQTERREVDIRHSRLSRPRWRCSAVLPCAATDEMDVTRFHLSHPQILVTRLPTKMRQIDQRHSVICVNAQNLTLCHREQHLAGPQHGQRTKEPARIHFAQQVCHDRTKSGGASSNPSNRNPGLTVQPTSVQSPVDSAPCHHPAGTIACGRSPSERSGPRTIV